MGFKSYITEEEINRYLEGEFDKIYMKALVIERLQKDMDSKIGGYNMNRKEKREFLKGLKKMGLKEVAKNIDFKVYSKMWDEVIGGVKDESFKIKR